jgi:flagellar hook assembly protein FlgD
MTGTPTFTDTPTETNTYTHTVSPTVTQTQIAFPYVLKISLYNSAGEIVKVLAMDSTNNLITSVQFYYNGVTDPSAISGDMPFEIYLPGVETPNTQGNGVGSSFTWLATNAQSQDALQGTYYIKTEQTDEYGHTTAIIKEITVLRVEKYIEMNIYNTAGELVRTIRKDNASTLNNKLDLDLDGSLFIDENGTPINIKYGTNLGEYMVWDGRDSEGTIVQNGVYEIQVIMKTDQDITLESTRTVMVLREGKNFIDQLIVQPNPYDGTKGPGYVTFRWTFLTAGETGKVTIRVYNVAGELVHKMEGDLANNTAGITWDLKIGSSLHVSRGIYTCVLEAKNSTGYVERKMQKMAVAGFK